LEIRLKDAQDFQQQDRLYDLGGNYKRDAGGPRAGQRENETNPRNDIRETHPTDKLLSLEVRRGDLTIGGQLT